MKICKDCQVEMPYSDFYKLKASSDGYDRRCKECAKSYRRSRSGPIPAEKKCSFCQEVKPSSGFYTNRNASDGLHVKCKSCQKKYYEKIKHRNKIVPLEKECRKCLVVKSYSEFYTDNYRLDGITAQCKECFANFYKENKEVYSKRKKKYRSNNRDRIYEVEKARRLANPEKYRAYAQKRLNLKKEVEFDDSITIELLRESLGDSCAYCGVTLNFLPKKKGDVYDPTWATIDHVLPLSAKGGWTKDNLTLACARDNVSKGNRDAEEWKRSKGYI